MKTQVAIIGAGPAGLLLGHLLYEAGIDTVILENRNESFLRANWKGGLLETDIAQFLIKNGVGERLQGEGIRIKGVHFHVNGNHQQITFKDKLPILYNQHDIVGDLIDKRKAAQLPIIFEGKAQRYEELDTSNPRIHYTLDAALHTLDCEFIIGCDGYGGISRRVIPISTRKEVKEELPYAWLDWLVDAPASIQEPIYAWHPEGFALQIPTSDGKTNFHLQVKRGTEKDDLPPVVEIWQQLETRLNTKINQGTIVKQKLDYMRQFHTNNWQYGRLYIAGDAAHVVERTGSKGINMAFADAIYLGEAIISFYKNEDQQALTNYTNRVLVRTLKVKEFTSWFTALLHINMEEPVKEKESQAQKILATLMDKASIDQLIKYHIGLPL